MIDIRKKRTRKRLYHLTECEAMSTLLCISIFCECYVFACHPREMGIKRNNGDVNLMIVIFFVQTFSYKLISYTSGPLLRKESDAFSGFSELSQ